MRESGAGRWMRPGLVRAALVGLALLLPLAGAAEQLDLSKPEDALKATQKMMCSLEDGKPIIAWWQGGAFSRVPGERDRHLFDVVGMNIRQCGSVDDEKRGPGFRSVSREIMLYLDPETGEVLRTWKNPWTGEEVEAIHVANDPVNMRAAMHAYGRKGEPHQFRASFVGNRVWTSGEVPLFYKNPLAGEYQEYVGGKYHTMEALNGYAYKDDLLDASKPTLEHWTLSWCRFSTWLPWMEMGDHAGMMIFTVVGGRVASIDGLSETLQAEIEKSYPEYKQPPPLDDARPNVTSWSYFKTVLDARHAAEKK